MGSKPGKKVWYRCSVDVDVAGHPIGSSWEVHDTEAGEVIRYGCMPTPGPFATTQEVLQEVLDTLPLQGALFT